jgi:hypothetical protein
MSSRKSFPNPHLVLEVLKEFLVQWIKMVTPSLKLMISDGVY